MGTAPGGSINLADATLAMLHGIGNYAGVGVWDRVTDLGDVNGDGVDNLAISSTTEDGNNGGVFVFLGPASGLLDPHSADGQFLGSEADLSLGVDIAGGHDLDGDGRGDLFASDEGNDSVASGGGALYAITGSLAQAGETAALADVTIVGAQPNLSFRFDVGDVDGDVRADLLLGTGSSHLSASGHGFAGSAGMAYLFHGPTSGTHTESDAATAIVGSDKTFGRDVLLSGNARGDNLVVLETAANAGAVSVFHPGSF